jgi:hypothetical protein
MYTPHYTTYDAITDDNKPCRRRPQHKEHQQADTRFFTTSDSIGYRDKPLWEKCYHQASITSDPIGRECKNE